MNCNSLMSEGSHKVTKPHARSTPRSPEVAKRQSAKEIKCQGETKNYLSCRTDIIQSFSRTT